MLDDNYEEYSAIYKSILWHEAEIAKLQKIVSGNLDNIQIHFFNNKVFTSMYQRDTFLSLDLMVKMIAERTIEGYKEQIERLKNSL
jgi:nitrous oxide reductase